MYHYFSFVRNHIALLLFGFLCVFFGNFGQSFFVGLFGSSIKAHFQLSSSEYGGLYSLATLLSAVVLVWVGALIDRWKLLRFTIFVGLGLFVASLGIYFSSATAYFFIALFLLRLFGQALLPHTGVTTMARVFDKNRGKAISLALMAIPCGEVILPATAAALLSIVDWKWLWLGIALLTFFIFIPLTALIITRLSKSNTSLETTAAKTSDSQKVDGGRSILLKDIRFWFALPVLVSPPFLLTAFFIHQDAILTVKQLPLAVAAQSFIALGIAHWITAFIFGFLVDRYSGVALLRFYTLPLFLAMLILASFDQLWAYYGVMALLGMTIGSSGTVVSASWAEIYGAEYLGTIRSVMSAIMVLSTALSPLLFGFLLDQQMPLAQLFGFSAAALLFFQFLLRFSYRPSEPL